MWLDECPNCHRSLSPPFKATGRQFCMKCGWSSEKPRQTSETEPSEKAAPSPALPADADLTPMDIQKLLKQAAAESLTNMKPKWKQQKEANAKKNPPTDPPLPPLG